MESYSFRGWIRRQNNLWIYASNITEFHYFDLEFLESHECGPGANHLSES